MERTPGQKQNHNAKKLCGGDPRHEQQNCHPSTNVFRNSSEIWDTLNSGIGEFGNQRICCRRDCHAKLWKHVTVQTHGTSEHFIGHKECGVDKHGEHSTICICSLAPDGAARKRAVATSLRYQDCTTIYALREYTLSSFRNNGLEITNLPEAAQKHNQPVPCASTQTPTRAEKRKGVPFKNTLSNTKQGLRAETRKHGCGPLVF